VAHQWQLEYQATCRLSRADDSHSDFASDFEDIADVGLSGIWQFSLLVRKDGTYPCEERFVHVSGCIQDKDPCWAVSDCLKRVYCAIWDGNVIARPRRTFLAIDHEHELAVEHKEAFGFAGMMVGRRTGTDWYCAFNKAKLVVDLSWESVEFRQNVQNVIGAWTARHVDPLLLDRFWL
jgi:hypothetical protein